jgi:hypothetical protein
MNENEKTYKNSFINGIQKFKKVSTQNFSEKIYKEQKKQILEILQQHASRSHHEIIMENIDYKYFIILL